MSVILAIELLLLGVRSLPKDGADPITSDPGLRNSFRPTASFWDAVYIGLRFLLWSTAEGATASATSGVGEWASTGAGIRSRWLPMGLYT